MTRARYPKFVMGGWKMLISTNRWRDVDIYFRVVGASIQLLGCDVFDDNRTYLGWVVRENINIEQQRMIKAYLQRNKRKWTRLHDNGGKSAH